MVLSRDPICRSCETTPSAHVDHIEAKASGGDDSLSNLQGLCEVCHQRKTHGERVKIIPDLRHKPAIPVTVVCGAPGSGKTSYCREHAGPSDLVIDLDDILREVSGTHGHDLVDRGPYLADALRKRNALLYGLSGDRKHSRAWLIVGAPKCSDRRRWSASLNATIVVVETDPATCKERVRHRPTASDVTRIVDTWWLAYVADPDDTIVTGSARTA